MRTPEESKALIEDVVRGIHMPEVLTVSDLERHLRLPARLVLLELEAGRLQGKRIGPDWRVHRAAVLAWLRGRGGRQ